MSSEATIDIPTGWLTGQPLLPDVCVAHGLPATRRVDFVVRSRPKIGSRKNVFQPGYTSLNRADEYTRQVRLVKVAGWPLCPRCLRQRTVNLTLAGVLFLGGLAALVTGFAVGLLDEGTTPALLIPILCGFAAMLLSPVPLQKASLPRIAHAEVVADGSAVRIAQASAGFAAQVHPHASPRFDSPMPPA